MADNGSNSVAIVAILLLVILGGLAFYFFVNKGGLSGADTGTTIKVDAPSTSGKS